MVLAVSVHCELSTPYVWTTEVSLNHCQCTPVSGERETVVIKHPSPMDSRTLSALPETIWETRTFTPLLRNFTVNQPSLTLIIYTVYDTQRGLSSKKCINFKVFFPCVYSRMYIECTLWNPAYSIYPILWVLSSPFRNKSEQLGDFLACACGL